MVRRRSGLSTAQTDRAAGVLLASAAGDALGVPYEFAQPPGVGELAEMKGGGLGSFAPGEWSDDTSMAIAIAEVAATGADLRTDDALDAIAASFLRWYGDGPADIGIQTSAVLGATRRRLDREGGRPAAVMLQESTVYAATHAHAAGNGALMRTAPVALAHLDHRAKLAQAARLVARLTHADPLAGDACVLWCEAIRIAVLDGRIDVRAGMDLLPADRRDRWASWLDEAETGPAVRFTPNGYTITALQAALAAITATPDVDCHHLQDALHAAVRIGDDTDTVAAIAGGLLGARWGASAVPWRWRRAVHGWPGRDGRDLVSLATLTVRDGRPDRKGWPVVDDVPYDERAARLAVPHPYDPGVLLGTHRSRGHGADAIVSLCRVGRRQACFDGATEVVESRLQDSEDPADNADLTFILRDAADAVRGLRAEGKTVLLHCVAAHQRTPSVAIAYAVVLGYDLDRARRDVAAVLKSARGWGTVWDAADLRLAP
ncbi:ADP-ribosylglycohydrolase family protein [Nocardioides agariphilus]|uniref:ADP-ribosylglycohydrolase family protein n=1 Tax=Nocardioides agariphilus TaxID=433664 RepID=A0A930VHB5_9ACTN|nr:ADP-ribosylglycohydrolase family protein [Nocardioides agariphilus]MBF4766623.1 ADP-ribosylglycohydrolase family protein [Nocardioides agariphilus]